MIPTLYHVTLFLYHVTFPASYVTPQDHVTLFVCWNFSCNATWYGHCNYSIGGETDSQLTLHPTFLQGCPAYMEHRLAGMPGTRLALTDSSEAMGQVWAALLLPPSSPSPPSLLGVEGLGGGELMKSNRCI